MGGASARARAALPLRALPDYPGSAIGWEDHLFPASAFDVELPAGTPDASAARSYATDLRSLLRAFAGSRA